MECECSLSSEGDTLFFKVVSCLLIYDLIANPEHSPKFPKNSTSLFSIHIGTTKMLF